jgi:hypothetical protein
MAYTPINWENNEQGGKKLNKTNLKQMDDGILANDKAITELDKNKTEIIELIAVADTAPTTCSKDDKYYNTTSNKIYTATEENTWGEATDPLSVFLYVDLADSKLYTMMELTLIPMVEEVEEVPQRERAAEYLMTRLRTTYGIQKEEYENKFLLPFGPLEQALESFGARDLAICSSDGHWYLTPEGFLLSNTIITDLQIIQERTMRG